MDPLRFRQRRLFRPAAIEYFVGAFGDSGTPELLAPRRPRLALFAVSVLVLVVLAWGFAGSLPVRVSVPGELVGSDDNRLYFRGDITAGQTIRPGQEARIAVNASPVSMVKGQVAAVTGGSAKGVVITLTPDEAGGYLWTAGRPRFLPSGASATAWVTVGRQAPWRFLLELVFRGRDDNEFI